METTRWTCIAKSVDGSPAQRKPMRIQPKERRAVRIGSNPSLLKCNSSQPVIHRGRRRSLLLQPLTAHHSPTQQSWQPAEKFVHIVGQKLKCDLRTARFDSPRSRGGLGSAAGRSDASWRADQRPTCAQLVHASRTRLAERTPSRHIAGSGSKRRHERE
jgi:hypothetical protein